MLLCVLRYDLRAPLCTSLLMLCIIAPFLPLRPKKSLARRASHIASRPVPRLLTLLVLAKLLCHAFAPMYMYVLIVLRR